MKHNYIISLICLCFGTLTSHSQSLKSTYPVQVTAFMNPPYSLKLEDYYNPAKPKLSITLLNRDLMEPVVDVKLHFSIKAGNGIRLETKDYIPYPIIRLQSGSPYLLSQTDLYTYLKSENLEIQGLLTNGQFSEGMIEFCILVLEAHTNKVLSQTSCARAWITLNRPPILNLPQNSIKLPFQEPQNILFQWTPRHQGLSNVEYQFILKEIWDETAGYQAAFPYSQEIYSTTIRNSSLPYSAMMPSLMENKSYAWQVRAVAKDGIEELSLFENNGYSEIHSFSIAQSCHAPQNVRHHQDRDHLVIEWEPSPETDISVVAYRSKGDNSEWKIIKGNENYTRLTDLAFNIEYEYKIGTPCSDGKITYSETKIAILEDWRKQFKISCGIIPAFDKSNFDPLPKLNIGDIFTAGDFPVTTSESTGSNGTFSGKGWITIPLFGFIKIAVQFNNVKINTSLQLVNGSIETSYDKDEKLIADMDRIWHGGDDTGFTKTGAVQSKVKANFSIPDGATGEYDNSTGEIVIKDKDGIVVGNVKVPDKDKEIFTSGNPYSYTIEDKDGKIFVLTKDENGKTGIENVGNKGKPLEEGSFSETSIARHKAVVEFVTGENSNYSFDTWKDYYQTVSLIVNKNTYEFIDSQPIACQLIPAEESEYIGFKVNKTDKNLIEDSIIFKTKTGYTVIPKHGQLHIAGGKDNDAQDLFALYPNGKGGYFTLGKLKILSYPKKTCNVVLVPVNGNNTDSQSVQEYLNTIYGKVGVQWHVETDSDFTYSYTDLHSEGSDLFSKYTDAMKGINSAYKTSRGNLDKNTVYLFILTGGSIKGESIAGDMPRGSQFGYVFTESGEDINRTIAHELGHGLFRLRHIFDGEYGGEAKAMKGKTDNLMDYGSGTHLAKWQWDEIHDPALLVSPFESDEDGMAKKGDTEKIIEFLKNARQSIAKGTSFNAYTSYMESDRAGFYILSDKYQNIRIRVSVQNHEKMIKLKKPDASEDSYLGGEKVYALTFNDENIRIMLKSKQEQQNLLKYLTGAGDAGSIALFVTGYDKWNEVIDFLNNNNDYKKELPANLLDYVSFVRKDIMELDESDYWSNFAESMMDRLNSKDAFYINGHNNLGTSNHRTVASFVSSLLSSVCATTEKKFDINALGNPTIVDNEWYHDKNIVKLNTDPNVSGFNTRKSAGRISGKDLVTQLKKSCSKNESGLIQDTLDVICHSMGFAHALGVIDEIKSALKSNLKGLTLGRFYIFAPENPSAGEVNAGDWKEIWHYGSNEDELKNQPWLLDGVAPQCPIGGIGGRRAFIPRKIPQGFTESHSISNYGWVFELNNNEKGYITPRK